MPSYPGQNSGGMDQAAMMRQMNMLMQLKQQKVQWEQQLALSQQELKMKQAESKSQIESLRAQQEHWNLEAQIKERAMAEHADQQARKTSLEARLPSQLDLVGANEQYQQTLGPGSPEYDRAQEATAYRRWVAESAPPGSGAHLMSLNPDIDMDKMTRMAEIAGGVGLTEAQAGGLAVNWAELNSGREIAMWQRDLGYNQMRNELRIARENNMTREYLSKLEIGARWNGEELRAATQMAGFDYTLRGQFNAEEGLTLRHKIDASLSLNDRAQAMFTELAKMEESHDSYAPMMERALYLDWVSQQANVGLGLINGTFEPRSGGHGEAWGTREPRELLMMLAYDPFDPKAVAQAADDQTNPDPIARWQARRAEDPNLSPEDRAELPWLALTEVRNRLDVGAGHKPQINLVSGYNAEAEQALDTGRMSFPDATSDPGVPQSQPTDILKGADAPAFPPARVLPIPGAEALQSRPPEVLQPPTGPNVNPILNSFVQAGALNPQQAQVIAGKVRSRPGEIIAQLSLVHSIIKSYGPNHPLAQEILTALGTPFDIPNPAGVRAHP